MLLTDLTLSELSFINETKNFKEGASCYSVTKLVFSDRSLEVFRENQTQFWP